MTEIILASNNVNKLKEIRSKLEKFNISVISQKEAGIDIDVEETGKTFKENAIIKAEAIYNILNKPALADDSGLEIDYLDGAPGVYSHRFCEGTDEDRYNKVLKLLKDVPEDKRTARYRCAMCFIDENGEKHIFEDKVEGIIGYEPKGTNGFGFDPIVISVEKGKTFAELTPDEKNSISHRGKAVAKFVEYIESIAK